ncbi:MAG: hydroxymethylglutaryl-CoA lyase [Deltaproteobacteria bacterium]|nr:hydroxymethylglutaryl-CoA lyase [Deltaproteobacteria bacterium]
MKARIYEVGLRDGLQNEAAFVPTHDKIELAAMLVDAGISSIELTSFVSPRWIPQLADHATVAAETPRSPKARFSALVPNLRGLAGAFEAQLEEVAVFMSVTDAHSKKNINKPVAEALDVCQEVVAAARAKGLLVRGYLSVVFGCPYEGRVEPGRVVPLVQALLDAGVYEVSLGDTIGVASPKGVKEVLSELEHAGVPFDRLALHMHDTRGVALANVLTGLDRGIQAFDTAFGGLGGCPYAPGASGNLATEDLVYMLESMGIGTGVDLDKVVDASSRASELVGRTLPSKVWQAETATRTSKDRHAAAG